MLENPSTSITPEVLQQNPLVLFATLAFFLLIVAFLASSLACWVALGIRKYRGLPILAIAPWSPRVWGLAELLLVLILALASQFAGVLFAAPLLGIDTKSLSAESIPLSLSAVISLGYMLVVVLSAGWIIARFRVGPAHVGFTGNGVQMLKIGLIAGLVILPVIYLGNMLVALGLQVEYKHPLLEAMKQSGTMQSFLLAAFSAAIAAPLAEEFLFRVVLQGWLQSIPFSSIPAIVLGANLEQRSDPDNELFYHSASHGSLDSGGPDEIIEAQVIDSGEGSEKSFSNFNSRAPNTPLAEPAAELLPPLWPAIVAGILFGFAHWGYGLSFIPLSVLGISLGLLYRATNSIWPCIIVHCMLNSSSMLALGVMMLLEQAAR